MSNFGKTPEMFPIIQVGIMNYFGTDTQFRIYKQEDNSCVLQLYMTRFIGDTAETEKFWKTILVYPEGKS